jgi:hypothetical protein
MWLDGHTCCRQVLAPPYKDRFIGPQLGDSRTTTKHDGQELPSPWELLQASPLGVVVYRGQGLPVCLFPLCEVIIDLGTREHLWWACSGT